MLIGGNDISNDVITRGAHLLSCVFHVQLQALLPFPATQPEPPGELTRRLLAGWHTTQWGKKNKEITSFKS